jgi:hypothetical protein
MEVSGQLNAPAASPLGKQTQVSIVWEAEWAPEPVWTEGEKNLLPLLGIELRLLNHPCRSPIAIPTELSRLTL